MPIPRLPQELIDHIIDAVADETPSEETLRSCTLTCRSWTPRARSHLFSTVTLMEPPTVLAFANLVLSTPRVGSDSPLELLPTLGTLVRHLRLGVPMTLQQKRKRRGYGFGFYTMADIPVCGLPRLQTLSIADIPDVRFYSTSMLCLRDDFRSVRKLYLHRGLLAPETLAGLLSGFPQLLSLRLQYDDCPRDRLGIRLLGDSPPSVSLPFSLRDLALGLPDPALVEWLVEHGGLAAEQLTSLAISFQPLDDLRPLQSMLHHVGKTLTDLTIGYVDPPYVLPLGLERWDRTHFVRTTFELFEASPLRENTSLRTLRIEGCEPIERSYPSTQDLHSWIPKMLEQVRSERIEEITFAFRSLRQRDSPMLSWIDWRTIGALLETPPLNQVRHVAIEVQQSEIPRHELYRRVAALLPLVALRDALRVRCIVVLPEDAWDTAPPREPRYMTVLDCVEEAIAPLQQETTASFEDYEWHQKEWDSIRSANEW